MQASEKVARVGRPATPLREEEMEGSQLGRDEEIHLRDGTHSWDNRVGWSWLPVNHPPLSFIPEKELTGLGKDLLRCLYCPGFRDHLNHLIPTVTMICFSVLLVLEH